MQFDDARHLLARTGFGGGPGEIESAAALDAHAAVNALLADTITTPSRPAPAGIEDPPPERQTMRAMSDDQKRALRQERRRQARELKAWWIEEMLTTSSPLTERMTLFWHNHFTSSLRKVKHPGLLYRQNLLLRRESLGSFRKLLHEVSADPAMIVYLDNQSNRAGNPNENFARELLELFTLGEGQYTETDIKEAARAFTGWTVDRRDGRFRFVERRHDDGMKTFLGREGRLGGDDILDILLEEPRTAEFIVAKLWRELVGGEPDPSWLAATARSFRDHDYEITPIVRSILLSDPFYALENRGTMIKSPITLVVGTLRTFEAHIVDSTALTRACAALGQDIFDPPNVKGWPGGNRWITSTTLLRRQQLLQRFARGRDIGGRGKNKMDRMDRDHRRPGLEARMRALWDACGGDETRVREVLLPIPPAEPGTSTSWHDTIPGLLLDPVYQLT